MTVIALRLQDGAMLFQLRQKGMNGVRNTAYRLWHDPNEPGSHHVEHFAQLFDPANGEDSGARPADGEEADEDTTVVGMMAVWVSHLTCCLAAG